MRATIEARGANFVHLPAYSPDENLIQQFFAKLKSHVRRIAPRTRGPLWQAVAATIDGCSHAEC